MGIAYFRLPTQALTPLWPLIRAHEAEPVGPRARGYWFDYPDDYDYDSVRETAQTLYEAGRAAAWESLELSENPRPVGAEGARPGCRTGGQALRHSRSGSAHVGLPE